MVLNGEITKSYVSLTVNQDINLTKVGGKRTGGDAYDVWVDEEKQIAYVACGYQGVRIFNISTPSDPVLMSHIPESAAKLNTGHNTAYAHQLLVKNDIIYVGDGPGGLTIINCSDPSNPYVLYQFLGGYTWDIQIVDNVAFIVNGWNNLGNPGFMILNVSNPSIPSIIKNFPTGFDVTDLEVVGNQAFLVCGDSSLRILDISNYSTPVVLGQYLGPSGSYTMDVEVSGNLAYLSFWKIGLKVLDISDPENITVKGEYTGRSGGEFAYLYLSEGDVFLAAMADGVVVLDVNNPEIPLEIGNYSDSGKAYGIFVRDNFVYVADQSEGLKILEIGSSSTDTSSFYKSPGFEFSIILLSSCIFLFSMRKRKRE